MFYEHTSASKITCGFFIIFAIYLTLCSGLLPTMLRFPLPLSSDTHTMSFCVQVRRSTRRNMLIQPTLPDDDPFAHQQQQTGSKPTETHVFDLVTTDSGDPVASYEESDHNWCVANQAWKYHPESLETALAECVLHIRAEQKQCFWTFQRFVQGSPAPHVLPSPLLTSKLWSDLQKMDMSTSTPAPAPAPP